MSILGIPGAEEDAPEPERPGLLRRILCGLGLHSMKTLPATAKPIAANQWCEHCGYWGGREIGAP